MNRRTMTLVGAGSAALIYWPTTIVGATVAHDPVALQSPRVSLTAVPVPHRDLYRGTRAQAKAEARYQARRYGWSTGAQWSCLASLWQHESDWRWNANNGDGYRTWGIPQAHPGRKMGRGWKTNTTVQIKWGLRYIGAVYGDPCRAWDRWQSRAASGKYGWY